MTPHIQLHNTDCKLVLGELCSVDAIVTDPPYGMAFQSNHNKTRPKHKKIVGDNVFDPSWLEPAYNSLRSGGALISFCDWGTSHLWVEAIRQAGFIVKSQVIWNRLHHGMGDLKGAFAPMHDVIWYATKGRREFVGGRPKSVIEVKRPGPTQDCGHPTRKPVELMRQLIRAIDDGKTATIVDPFMGSGSTGEAAVQLGYNFIGCEIDREYFDTANARIELATGSL